jgi:hypothetical protein
MRRLMLTIVQAIGTTAAFAQLPPEPSYSTRCRPAAMWDTAPALSVGITRQLFTASPATALRSDDQPTPEREAVHHPQLSRRLGPQAAVRDSASLASLNPSGDTKALRPRRLDPLNPQLPLRAPPLSTRGHIGSEPLV